MAGSKYRLGNIRKPKQISASDKPYNRVTYSCKDDSVNWRRRENR